MLKTFPEMLATHLIINFFPLVLLIMFDTLDSAGSFKYLMKYFMGGFNFLTYSFTFMGLAVGFIKNRDIPLEKLSVIVMTAFTFSAISACVFTYIAIPGPCPRQLKAEVIIPLTSFVVLSGVLFLFLSNKWVMQD